MNTASEGNEPADPPDCSIDAWYEGGQLVIRTEAGITTTVHPDPATVHAHVEPPSWSSPLPHNVWPATRQAIWDNDLQWFRDRPVDKAEMPWTPRSAYMPNNEAGLFFAREAPPVLPVVLDLPIDASNHQVLEAWRGHKADQAATEKSRDT